MSNLPVIPAKAGIQSGISALAAGRVLPLDSRFRGNDGGRGNDTRGGNDGRVKA
jgi:hypothetical protein